MAGVCEYLTMLGELVMVAGLLATVVAAQLVLSRSADLFRRQLWADEIVTLTLVTDPSLRHALRALAAGVDTNPPTYLLLLRAFVRLTGQRGEAVLRGLSLLTVLAGLVGLYLALRQVFEPLPAFAGVLAVWVHPLTQRYAFELRMYGPWLAAVIWFTTALSYAWEAPLGPGLGVGLAAASLLACTLHTLGPLAVGLATATHLLSHAATPWSWPALACVAVGPLAFLAWTPVVWRQNFAYGITWIRAPTLRSSLAYLQALLLPSHLAVLALAAGFALVWGYAVGNPKAVVEPALAAHLAGLLGLALLPLVAVILSWLIQPILIERYALPGVAALAPVAAWVGQLLPAPGGWGLGGLLLVWGWRGLKQLRASYPEKEEFMADLMAGIRNHTGTHPVLFEDIDELYIACRYAPDVAERCFGLDFEAGQLGEIDAYALGLRDHMRLLTRFYQKPGLLRWEALRRCPQCYLAVAITRRTLAESELERRYPGFAARGFWPGLFEMHNRRTIPGGGAEAAGGGPLPRVSIVVPNYNHARFLPERLESLLSQSFTEFELLVLDDGSTDNSRAVIARYTDDPRVRVHHFSECSGSPYRRFNDGAARARGEFLYIANSDDGCEPTLLAKLVAALDRRSAAGLAYCHSRMVDHAGMELYSTAQWASRIDRRRWAADYQDCGRNECQYLVLGNEVIPTTSAVLMRRSVFEQAGGFDLTLPVGADFMLWARMLLRSDVAFVAEPLNHWRWHPDGVTFRAMGPEGQAKDLVDLWRVVLFLKENLEIPPDRLDLACDRFVTMWIHRTLLSPKGISATRQAQLYRLARRADRRVRARIRRLLFTTQDFFGSLDRLTELEGQYAALAARFAGLEAAHAPFTYLTGAVRGVGHLAARAVQKRWAGPT